MNIKEFRTLLKDETQKDIILKELLDFLNEQENPSKAFPCDKYNFTYKTAVSVLSENKLIKPKHREKTPDSQKPNFSISNRKNDELMTRSFSIEQGTYERLQEFLDKNKKSFSLQGYALSELLERGMDFFK